jgi:hypothetical protein
MSLIIDLSDEVQTSLASKARAANMPTEDYAARIIEHALRIQSRRAAENLERSLDQLEVAFPLETTPEQMEAALEEALAAVRPQRCWRS